jgi:CBS domain-containing protein
MPAQTVKDVMTAKPVCVKTTEPLGEVARQMKQHNIGDVMVVEGGKGARLTGVITDRDIVVRCVAADKDPRTATAGDIASPATVTVPPDASVEEAVALMRENAVRRLPVTEGSNVVGVVSLGDLAMDRDSRSALAGISAAPPNQ